MKIAGTSDCSKKLFAIRLLFDFGFRSGSVNRTGCLAVSQMQMLVFYLFFWKLKLAKDVVPDSVHICKVSNDAVFDWVADIHQASDFFIRSDVKVPVQTARKHFFVLGSAHNARED